MGPIINRPSPQRAAPRQAPVAQLDRAPDYESGGQRFESFRVRHIFYYVIVFIYFSRRIFIGGTKKGTN